VTGGGGGISFGFSNGGSAFPSAIAAAINGEHIFRGGTGVNNYQYGSILRVWRSSVYGGGAGGANSAAAAQDRNLGGMSIYGGAGGNSGVAGTAPGGGGGGGAGNNQNGANGAAGRVIVTVF
jgi:hypothetical protein